MDRVKSLYFSFSPSEKKAIRSYLDAFHQKGENKPLEFLKFLDQHPGATHENASQKLYGDSRSKAFIMMKGRLYERLTEFLTLSINPDSTRRNRETPYHQDLIEFRRCMLFASSLQERQLSALALEYLEKARELAARCNAPELEVDALIRLRGLDRSGGGRFEELSIQIQKALKMQECDINATGLMRKFLTLTGSLIGGDADRIAFLEAHLPELEDAIRQVYSARADYFLQSLQVHYAYLTRRYQEGRVYAQKALAILNQHEGIRSPARMADGWFQLGRLELQDQQFETALVSLEKARGYQTEVSRAYLTTSLLIVYCYIYLRDFHKAQELMAYLEDGPTARALEQSPLNKGLFSYLRACMQYFQGSLKEAWALIQDCQELNLDKETWLTAIRLFEIMVLVDKQEPDLASQKIENLRKHISRYNPKPRMRAIFKLLQAQDRAGFRFVPIQDEDHQLAQLRTEMPWDVIGQEVVRFEDWYSSHRTHSR